MKRHKDGWLRRNSAKDLQHISSVMNSDDEVVHFPSTDTDRMEKVDEAMISNGIDQVTIERDHSGQCSSSLFFK